MISFDNGSQSINPALTPWMETIRRPAKKINCH